MRRRVSQAWEELGYCAPALVNVEGAQARQEDRRELQERKEAAAAVPVRREVAKSVFARMHAVVDGAASAVALFGLCFLCGCADSISWTQRVVPTTDEERQKVAEHAERVLAGTPRTLSGHDQDWDDAIAQAHRDAVAVFCRPTMWELRHKGFPDAGCDFTGRWMYCTNVSPR